MIQPSLYANPPVPRRMPDTREKAHQKVKPKIREIQIMLLTDLYNGAHISADAWTLSKGWSDRWVYLVRPRLSNFKKAGLIYRNGFGSTIDGNNQEKFKLLPIIRDRMRTLVAEVGLDKAVVEILTVFDVEDFSKSRIASAKGADGQPGSK
jgi:hypothetical protein